MATPASVCQNCLQTVPESEALAHEAEHDRSAMVDVSDHSAKGEEFQGILKAMRDN